MLLSPKIFRAYDIRGEAFVDFDEDGFFVVAQAFGQFIRDKWKQNEPKVFVSGDGRQSMPELWPAVVAGLQAAGCEVHWGGAIPTPLNLFARQVGGFCAAVQISASHNQAPDNGLKLEDSDGPVFGEDIQKIRAMAECQDCEKGSVFGECAEGCKVVSFLREYHAKLQELFPAQKPRKIVVDCGNAIPGLVYPDILRKLGHEVIELYCDLDTRFPNHQPDPEEPENLQDLIQKVDEVKADFGFAFDGDGDRLGIVLPKGLVLSANKILAILAADHLSRNPDAPVVVDAMTSATLMEFIRKQGGKPILSRTGHSYIVAGMKQHRSQLGGEQSGHFMMGEEFYGHDDALVAGLRFLQAMEIKPELLKTVTTDWPQMQEYSQKIPVADEEKFKVLEAVTAELKAQYPNASTLDGVRIDWEEGEWGIVRCSNTSPKISLRVEAKTQTSLKEKKQVFLRPLQKHLSL